MIAREPATAAVAARIARRLLHPKNSSQPHRHPRSLVNTCPARMFGFKNKPPAAAPPAIADEGRDKPGLLQRLRSKLNQGDSWLTYDLANLIPGGKIDESVLEELETRLITADVGVETTERILVSLRKKVARNELA